MDRQSDSFLNGLMKWDTLLGQRVLDAISFLVPAILFAAFALSPKANDLENGLIQFQVLSCFLIGSFIRLLLGWNRLRSFQFQVGSALFDVGCLFAYLMIIPIAYGSPIAISLKAPTANLLFVFIVARIVLFDLRLIVWSGASAALGWIALTALAVIEPDFPGITHEFVDYTTSGKVLIGAQVEQVISILLVTVVAAAVVNAYQRDGLTGLRKKREFLQVLKRRLPKRSRRGPTALILVQIENWHDLANSNKAGANQAIKDLANALIRAPVPHEMAARFEADTIILWKRCVDDDTALRHHLDVLKSRADQELSNLNLVSKIGAVRTQASADKAVRNVVLAAEKAGQKESKIQLCDHSFEQWLETRHGIKEMLDGAIAADRLIVLHQPIVDVLSGRMVGTEALIRLRSDDGEMVSPSDFIPIAEQSGAIDEIGAYVLETASRDNLMMRESGLPEDFFVSVNVSPLQVHFWNRLKASVEMSLNRGTNLKLEITESSAAQDERLQTRLIELRDAGAKLAIDDFGTGYSSLGRLREMPFDTVKIDISFTRKIMTDTGFSMIDAIVRMAKSSGKDVIIEGVETAQERALAMRAGIRLAQGYHFSRPLSVDELLSQTLSNDCGMNERVSA